MSVTFKSVKKNKFVKTVKALSPLCFQWFNIFSSPLIFLNKNLFLEIIGGDNDSKDHKDNNFDNVDNNKED